MNQIRLNQPFSVSNLTHSSRAVLLVALFGIGAAQTAKATPSHPLRDVQTLYDLGGQGNAYFNTQMRREIRAAGFRFVPARKNADATLTTQGNWTKNGGFKGSITFRDLSGRLLWSKNVVRPANSRVMAFQSLSRELQAAK